MALKPCYQLRIKIKRVGVCNPIKYKYQESSKEINQLDNQVAAIVANKPVEANILPSASMPKHYQIAFNVIPQIDAFLEDGYTKEEMKMVHETNKIFDDYNMGITATTIRIPVYRSHSESINLEFDKEVSVEKAKSS